MAQHGTRQRNVVVPMIIAAIAAVGVLVCVAISMITNPLTARRSVSSAASFRSVPSSAIAASSKADADRRKIAALEAPISAADRTDILNKARQAALEDNKTPQQLKYCVSSRGNVGSVSGFANTIFRVLNNPRGWPRAGVIFTQGSGSACDFTIYLSAPNQMTTFSEGCSNTYSCRVGNDVIINAKRWNKGIDNWLAAGGTLSQYRTMVINHEVGHRLGHIDNETTCAGAGKAAPLMQEQSMHLDGCSPNSWPLDNELWTDLTD